jgi:hypothetical protein
LIALGVSTEGSTTVPGSSRASPTKRKPFRGSVLISRLFFSVVGDGAARQVRVYRGGTMI